jgi:hypothetical protein
MPDISGTLRKVTLDGVTFDVMADTNVTAMGSNIESDGVPTSGRLMRKMTKRADTREGVVLACNGAEFELLNELATRITDFSMSYEEAGGDVYRCQGFIEFENRETEENRASIKMFSRSNEWETFLV